MKDVNFYDKESGTYSDKRYPKIVSSYNQFFFTERLRLVLKMLDKNISEKKNLSLLEIGCADGIVIEKIYENFRNVFSSIAGIDISPEMIRVALEKYSGKPFTFKIRSDFSDALPKDVVVEIGVINYADISSEFRFAYDYMKTDSIYIISLAGTNSLWNRIKKGDKGFNNFLSYQEYEKEIRKNFDILSTSSVGLFIPLIWKLPALARIIQPIETVFRPILPNCFHEKIYLLKKK